MEDIIKKCLPTYRIVEKIGEGIYGRVYRIRDELKERAAKIVPIQVERSVSYKNAADLDSKVSQDFHAVREYYEKIKGDGVIDIHDFHLVGKKISNKKAQAYLIILMELCPENLHDHVVDHFPVPSDSANAMMIDLAAVLSRLTDNLSEIYLLSDLKPSNLLITRSHKLIIGDLGGLKRLSSVSTASNAQFTPSWSAPELILRGMRPKLPSVIYSFGLVAYFLWEGRLPYEKADFTERVHLIRENGIRFERRNIPMNVVDLIVDCTRFDPADRPENFGEVLERVRPEKKKKTSARAVSTSPVTVGKQSVTDSFDRSRPSRNLPLDRSRSGERRTLPGIPKVWKEPVAGITFVWIPSGTFFPFGKASGSLEMDGFWMSRYPVTQKEWEMMTGSNPSRFTSGKDNPVEQVSWNEAQHFLRRLCSRSDRSRIFRLPTELEWEFSATSCGIDNRYDSPDELDENAWYQQNSNFSTHPVGRKKANAAGLHDMCGNVMEWCEDPYLGPERRLPIPRKRHSGAEWNRVIKGGSWHHVADQCRIFARKGVPSGIRYSYLGFRLVCQIHE